MRVSRNKYHNSKLKNDFGSFDSKKEFNVYLLLLNKLKNGELTDLRRQVRYELIPPQYKTGQKQLKTKTKEVRKMLFRPCNYIADFTYVDKSGNTVVVDVKSTATAKDKVYLIKKKLMYCRYGVLITEL